MRQFQHFAIVVSVAIGVNDRVPTQVVPLANAAHFCRSGTITVTVLPGQPAVAFFKLCADASYANAVAPGIQVRIERCGHDDDRVTLCLVPTDTLKRAAANDPREYFRCVSPTKFTNGVGSLALEAHSRDDWSCVAC